MRLGHFDLNLFIALDALLETRSITRAAERLHIGASATSSALGRLREQFGDELLVQVGRKMELTALAESLRQPVREIMIRAQATIEAKAEFDPAVEQRRFVFHASDYATTVLLTPLARQLEQVAPGISLDVVGLGDSNLDRLERGDVDFAIYPEVNASPAHPQQLLLEEDYSCVVWTGNPHVGKRITFDQYLNMRHVATQFGDTQRVPTFESWFLSTYGVSRNVVVSISTFSGLAPLVVGTECIATVHTRLARLYARTLPLRLLKPPIDIPKLKLVMQWNRHRDRDAAHVWLRERLVAVAREQGRGG